MGGSLWEDFLNSLVVSWVNMGILLPMFSGFLYFTKGPPGSMWGTMLYSDFGVRSFRDTVVRDRPRVTFGLLSYQHLVHAFCIDL